MQATGTFSPRAVFTQAPAHGCILVTGANGFVGSALARQLAQRGAALRLAVRSLPPDSHADTVAVGSIGADTDWFAALQGVDVVVHLAARVHVMRERNANPLAAFRAVNVAGTANLAKQAAQSGVRRFVYVSSVKVNGEKTAVGQSFTESDTPCPQDAYGQSKWEAEQCLQTLCLQTGMEWVVVRPSLVYGPGVKGNIAILAKAIRHHVPLPFARLNNQRSVLGLDNLVDFLMLVCSHRQAANQTFLVSDRGAISTPELVRQLALQMGVKPLVFPVPARLLYGGAKLLGFAGMMDRLAGNLQVSSAKAHTLLHWQPPLSLQEGLRRMVSVHAVGKEG